MNQSELNNLGTLAVAVLGPLAVKYGVDAGTLGQLVPAVLAAGWGIYSHWDQKKVPETAVVVGGTTK